MWQEALGTIQQQDSGAAIVDSYKVMFKQILDERNALAERNVDLEYRNALLSSKLDSNKHSDPLSSGSILSSEVNFTDTPPKHTPTTTV